MRCRSLVNGLGAAGAFNRSGYRTDNLVQQVVGPPYRLACLGESIQANRADTSALRAPAPLIGALDFTNNPATVRSGELKGGTVAPPI